MVFFDCDYNNGCHPAVLKRLGETNGEYTSTYGFDRFSDSAREKIRAAANDPDAGVFFLAGGTQANSTVIDSMLEPWQGVVSADTGHINVHEAGAVEYTGHKVFSLPSGEGENAGKIIPKALEDFLAGWHSDETCDHMAEPALVYISFPTELGTIYKAAELKEIHDICHRFGARLFVDGARLAYGLASKESDVDLPFLASHCDAFYIGGTKCGALCGEAVVFPKGRVPAHFFTRVKQHGALLAKGRLIGVQFDALFTDGLYTEIGKHADGLAAKIPVLFEKYGVGKVFAPSPTNQQFILVRRDAMEALKKDVCFEKWAPAEGGYDLCRFVTSWATADCDMESLENILKAL